MSLLPASVTVGFDLLCRASLQAGILIVVILALRLIVGQRLPGRWLCALWGVLLVRLALPWTPESSLSLYRIVPQLGWASDARGAGTMPMAKDFAPMGTAPSVRPGDVAANAAPAFGVAASSTNVARPTGPEPVARWKSWSIREAVCLIWLGGVVALGVSVLAGNLAFLRAIRRESPIIDEAILRLLEECKQQMKVRTLLSLVASSKVNSPALCGFIRPRLLLPKSMVRTLSHAELRHIFLHELAHLKRHDVFVSWLMSMLQVLHWLNPLVWIALRRMRGDRELACDGMALAVLGPGKQQDYGKTLIHVFESFRGRQYLPALASIMDTPSQLQRRITMIAQPKRSSRWSALLGTGLVVGLAIVALTDSPRATAGETKNDDKAAPVATATSGPCDKMNQEEAVLPEGSIINKNGRIVDKIDRPFVDDPEVLGKWESVDYVGDIERFDPKKPQTKSENLFLKGLVFSAGGKASWPWMGWTKGFVFHSGDKTASKYTIKQIDGITYLFFEWKSGDYIIRHRKPMLYVLKKLPANSTRFQKPTDLYAENLGGPKAELGPDSHINEQGWIVDKTDYPFVSDPQAMGKWESVDYVSEVKDFDPKKPKASADQFFLKGLVFSGDGIANLGWARWTKGLVLLERNHTASTYAIKDIDGVPYMFFEWKSGDYTIAHRRPDLYVLKKLPADSTKFQDMKDLFGENNEYPKVELSPDSQINKQGRIVDKIDYPFVDDPQIVGQWKSVDFVREIGHFNPASPEWKGDLFLKQMVFLPNGRTPYSWSTWTKGMIFHAGDHTASKYTLREMDGSTYMFFEWKSGDYTIWHRRPAYYVLKKVSSDTGSLGAAWAKLPSDQEFAKTLQAKVAGLNIDTATREDLIKTFGEPGKYAWNNKILDPKNLPENYIMDYPAGFSVFMSRGRIWELRFDNPGYQFEGKLQVGASVEDALKLLDAPLQTVDGEKLAFKDRVLYKNLNGKAGTGYYGNQDRHVRIFFYDDQVRCIYVTNSHAKPWGE